MKKRLERALIAAIAGAALLGGAGIAGATPAQAQQQGERLHFAMLPPSASYGVSSMSTGRETSPPLGYVQFCQAQPAECGHANDRGGQVVLDQAGFSQLVAVNADINARIKPMTDLDHYGVVEYWAYPDDGYGDCEDYVLLKRRTLIGLGWPAETLLITVVRDVNGEGHSVLTVVTDRGDLVLDNQNDKVRSWLDTPYRYVKRQMQGQPDRWVSLGDARAPATVGRN
ncbi:transglutaminase-like cysteine peptidase [Ancylobacter lacus]|uniref:transglutaminase-like cysteine peptidase n=1 Tax=Ancylobacter lacus TaxID=2579970 RepID=UPI001BCD27D5|nr:transglutaminase-like cysteine peptidase [Ancylobacter lacus]MBS7540765.1 transglutaminase-like cysteine peptidase [Ancylobacter lacus]